MFARKGSIVLCSLTAIILLSPLCYCTTSTEQADPNSEGLLSDMELEDLMNVPVIVSASRRGQEENKLTAAVSVVSSDDIHYSGLTNIPEILQFVPGVDVVKFNRSLYGVGIHGMHETVSNRVLSLVDGRFANNPIFGGPEFHRLPIFLEDIDHIEIVRGPGGAAWGANAFTGVINIITKDPEDTLGYFGSTTFNEFGDSYTHLRWGEKNNDWTWRFSGGYEDVEDSHDAGAGRYTITSPSLSPFIGYNNYAARDFSRNWRFDSKGVYKVSDKTKVSIGAGYSHITSGDFEVTGYYPMKNNRSELLRVFTKIEQESEDGSSGYIQWSGNLSSMSWVNVTRYKVIENDIEAQFNFAPIDNHHITIGGNFRWDDIKIKGISSLNNEYYNFQSAPYNECLTGFFAMDRWDVTDRLTLEAQIRGDYYSEIGTDWSNRFTALYDLDGSDKHTLRFSVAKAFRSPLVSLRKLQSGTIYLGSFSDPIGELYSINIILPKNLKNEETWALEAGYTGILSDNVTVNIDTFYQRLSNLIGYRMFPWWWGTVQYQADNIDGGDLYGAEIELAYKDKRKSISAWYAYNELHLDQAGQQIRAYNPSKHKCGLTGRIFLNDGWTFNANYKFTDTANRNPFVASGDASMNVYHRLDLTISKIILNGRGELMFGVSDLLNKTTQAVAETITVTGHETPGQTFFARLQLRF